MLRERLKRRMDVILDRWYEDVLSGYSAQAFEAWSREQDRFANPVGHSLRAGMQAILRGAGDGLEPVAIRSGLDEAIRIRAVQQLSPAEAVGFIFRLKPILRAELEEAAVDARMQREWVELEGWIDAVALVAFDSFAEHRERVFTLRINELKKNIPWVVTRAQQATVERGPV